VLFVQPPGPHHDTHGIILVTSGGGPVFVGILMVCVHGIYYLCPCHRAARPILEPSYLVS